MTYAMSDGTEVRGTFPLTCGHRAQFYPHSDIEMPCAACAKGRGFTSQRVWSSRRLLAVEKGGAVPVVALVAGKKMRWRRVSWRNRWLWRRAT